MLYSSLTINEKCVAKKNWLVEITTGRCCGNFSNKIVLASG